MSNGKKFGLIALLGATVITMGGVLYNSFILVPVRREKAHNLMPIGLQKYDSNRDGKIEWAELGRLSYDLRDAQNKVREYELDQRNKRVVDVYFNNSVQSTSQNPVPNR